MEDDDQASHSDHVMIEWEWKDLTMKVHPKWKIRGWALKKGLDQEKEGKKEGTEKHPTLCEAWIKRTEAADGFRDILDDISTADELADEIEWIPRALIDILNEHTKVIIICPRFKPW